MEEKLESLAQIIECARGGNICPECPALANLVGRAASALSASEICSEGSESILEASLLAASAGFGDYELHVIPTELGVLIAKLKEGGCLGPIPNDLPAGASDALVEFVSGTRERISQISVDVGMGEIVPEVYRCSLVDFVI